MVHATSNARKFKGPKNGGRWSAHVNVTAASGATSAMTFGYSNLPDPDPAVDAHWKDSGVTSIDLTATGVTFVMKSDVCAEWIRCFPVVVTSAGAMYVWTRVDGVDN